MLSDKFEEFAKTLFIIDKPMNRWSYFKFNIIWGVFVVLQLYVIFICSKYFLTSSIYSKIISSTLLISLTIFVLVVSIVLSSKRLWDILGKKKLAIVFACVIVLVIFPICRLFYKLKYLKFIISMLLLFIKGKKQASIQHDENKEENSKEG